MQNEFTILSFDDGRAVEEMNEAVRRAATDVANRREVTKPRKMVFELKLEPQDGGFLKISASSKVVLPPDEARKALCSFPDAEGRMRDLNGDNSGQLPLPIDNINVSIFKGE